MSRREKIINFEGEISAVTMRGAGAVVKLNNLTAGFNHAVISDETVDAINIMSQNPDGVLQKGLKVCGIGTASLEAIRVTHIQLACK